jgi:hypothetical protein
MTKLYIAEFPGLSPTLSGDAAIDSFVMPPTAEQVLDSTGTTGAIATLGAITAGTGGASGTYKDVPLTGGTGTGAIADITVNGGGVVSVVFTGTGDNRGLGYTALDTLSAASGNIGGTTTFSVPVATISIESKPLQVTTKFVSVSSDGVCSIAFSQPGGQAIAAVTNMRLTTGERRSFGVQTATNPLSPLSALLTQQISVITNT